MKILTTLLLLIIFIGCEKNKSKYYLSDESHNYGLIYTKHHYTLVEKHNDSVHFTFLDNDPNAGYYSWKEPLTIKAEVGTHGDISIKKITDEIITCELKRGDDILNLHLVNQKDDRKPFELINIFQSLKIMEEYEKYIHSNTNLLSNSTLYLTNNYTPDKNCNVMTPEDFRIYFSEKLRARADSLINSITRE